MRHGGETSAVGDALAAATDGLAAAGVDTPRLDAEVLLAEAMGAGRAALVADPGAELAPAAARRFGELVRRRLRREPVAYILGRRGFRHIDLAVDRRVLVPRPETEMLVEVALERRPARLLDVGTGSGAIALAVADEMPGCEVVASDTSAAALAVARANAERLGLAGRVRFVEGTLPHEENDGAASSFDLVLANLPYVPEPDWAALPPEVREWEPREALLAGADGLDAYRFFIPECCRGYGRYAPVTSTAPSRSPSAPSGPAPPALAVEVGMGQASAVVELMRGAGFEEVEVRRDLAGIERVVLGVLAAGGGDPGGATAVSDGRAGP